MKYIIPILAVVVIFSCKAKNNSKLEKYEEVAEKLKLKEPVSYILSEFKTHDIIFLGEPHKVKEHLAFLQQLMPEMHKIGVNTLFYEFANYDDSARIRELINATVFNDSLAKDILESFYWEWNFQDYADVFRTAWQINKTEPDESRKFRIIGVNSSDWTEKRMQNWTEENWANCIITEAVNSNKKALVFCGTHHAITKFQQPYARNGKYEGIARKDRMGHYVYKKIGDKCMTIWMHYLWGDENYKLHLLPCQGYLDSLTKTFPGGKQEFAFSTTKSPLGELNDSVALYSKGYNPVQLKQITDGYIVLGPICNLNFVEEASNFVTSANINRTNQQVKFYYKWDNITVKNANDTLVDWFKITKKEFYDRAKAVKCN